MIKIWHYASYHLWSLFSPPVGQESWHCDRKRGYLKARKKHSQVQACLQQDSSWQRIGLLAQKGVYEFHKCPQWLQDLEGIDQVAAEINLQQESEEIQGRVRQVLQNYWQNPILEGKDVIKLIRGDEGYPQPILIQQDDYRFNLYAAIDCIFREPDGTLHILDFKTGKSDFDRRQALVYLLAVSYLYPGQKAVASFCNLESQKQSKKITATPLQLQVIQEELIRIAKQHQRDLGHHRQYPEDFDQIFPANPGNKCQYCQFAAICEFIYPSVAA